MSLVTEVLQNILSVNDVTGTMEDRVISRMDMAMMIMTMMVVVMMMAMMMISFKRYHGHYADIFIDTPKKSTQSMMNGRLPNILIIGHSHFVLFFSLHIIYSLLCDSILFFIFWPRAGSSLVGE